jgi:hypothetical protein
LKSSDDTLARKAPALPCIICGASHPDAVRCANDDLARRIEQLQGENAGLEDRILETLEAIRLEKA